MKTILIADDLIENQELIREALVSPEYEFSEAENAGEVLQIMRDHPADLVISDVRMPKISGLDLRDELRSKYPEATVILATAFGTVESAVEAMKAGTRDYITRPINLRELGLLGACS